MTGPSDNRPELSPFDEIRFVEHHRPGLEAGDYDLALTQGLELPAPGTDPTPHICPSPPFEKTQRFSVLGDRYELAPEAIHAVFPPAKSRGDHWHHFPHVILNRSTLPWERSACDAFDKNTRPPWLALLLFDEHEMLGIERTVVSLSSLKPGSGVDGPHWPKLVEEYGQQDSDQVVVIDVPWKTLQKLLPRSLDDFGYRTHTRRVVQPSTCLRIYEHPGQIAVLIERLHQKWTDGELTRLFALDGVALGPPSKVEWPGWKHDEPWRLVDFAAGDFEVERPMAGGNAWLRVSGGPVPETGALEPEPRHHFVALDGSLESWTEQLNGEHLPDDLKGLLTECGIDVGDPQVTTHAKQEGSKEGSWRLTDTHSDLHHLIKRITDESGVARLEVQRYGDPSAELAVVMGNRLPAPGQRSVVHLVSLERRYAKIKEDCAFRNMSGAEGDVGTEPATTDTIRLVSLKSWDFFCLGGKPTFMGLLEGLLDGLDHASDSNGLSPASESAGSPLFHLPLEPVADDGTAERSKSEGEVRQRLAAGFVPLRHRMRRGDRSVSWYHGPLVPRAPKAGGASPLLPAKTADELVIFDRSSGLFDVSYAAAWEIGRMVTLANTRLATSLFHWKRSHAHELQATRHMVDLGFQLPVRGDAATGSEATRRGELPPDLDGWFRDLTLLRHVPFTYLVPDERLLPPESLRFFQLDRQWLECVRDGAFSIGRVLPAELERDRLHAKHELPDREPICGVLLRSEVVADYPGLLVDAYRQAKGDVGEEATLDSHPDPAKYPALECLRVDRLAPGVLLCLFSGDLRFVDVHLKPETLHFGLDPLAPDQIADMSQRQKVENMLLGRDPAILAKHLRRGDGGEITAYVRSAFQGGEAAVHFDKARRLVDFPKLAQASANSLLKPPAKRLDPAIFALEMVAGVELVRFVRHDVHGSKESS